MQPHMEHKNEKDVKLIQTVRQHKTTPGNNLRIKRVPNLTVHRSKYENSHQSWDESPDDDRDGIIS